MRELFYFRYGVRDNPVNILAKKKNNNYFIVIVKLYELVTLLKFMN